MNRTRWTARGKTIVSSDRAAPLVMGIVNCSPESFSDGGQVGGPAAALARARRFVDEGAGLIDVGGESSRPGADPIALDEELRRVLPVVEGLAAGRGADVPISIDTTKAEVARRACAAGAAIINDISAMTADPEMGRAAVETGAGVVLVHMRGTPKTMQDRPRYDNVVAEVYDVLARRIDRAESIGVPRDRIAIDPGIGFGKTFEHNLDLLRGLGRFATLGCVVLIGTSRKGFLGSITGRPPRGRASASVVSALAACLAGARVVRAHDVAATVDAIKVWTAIHGWENTT